MKTPTKYISNPPKPQNYIYFEMKIIQFVTKKYITFPLFCHLKSFHLKILLLFWIEVSDGKISITFSNFDTSLLPTGDMFPQLAQLAIFILRYSNLHFLPNIHFSAQ